MEDQGTQEDILGNQRQSDEV